MSAGANLLNDHGPDDAPFSRQRRTTPKKLRNEPKPPICHTAKNYKMNPIPAFRAATSGSGQRPEKENYETNPSPRTPYSKNYKTNPTRLQSRDQRKRSAHGGRKIRNEPKPSCTGEIHGEAFNS